MTKSTTKHYFQQELSRALCENSSNRHEFVLNFSNEVFKQCLKLL